MCSPYVKWSERVSHEGLKFALQFSSHHLKMFTSEQDSELARERQSARKVREH